jgi:hypothetical protein
LPTVRLTSTVYTSRTITLTRSNVISAGSVPTPSTTAPGVFFTHSGIVSAFPTGSSGMFSVPKVTTANVSYHMPTISKGTSEVLNGIQARGTVNDTVTRSVNITTVTVHHNVTVNATSISLPISLPSQSVEVGSTTSDIFSHTSSYAAATTSHDATYKAPYPGAVTATMGKKGGAERVSEGIFGRGFVFVVAVAVVLF